MEPDKYYCCKMCVDWKECQGQALAEDGNDCARGGPWWTEEAKKEMGVDHKLLLHGYF